MILRQAVLKDIKQLSALFNQYRIFYEQESDIKAAVFFLTQRLKKEESIIFVAEEENILIGFVQLYPIFSSTRMKRLWLLNDLFVNPKYRGKGVSIKLIDQAKALARNTNSAGLILETAKTNDIGNKLYPKTGFVLDKGHNYYSWDT